MNNPPYEQLKWLRFTIKAATIILDEMWYKNQKTKCIGDILVKWHASVAQIVWRTWILENAQNV